MPTEPSIIQVVSYYPPHVGGMEIVAKNISEGLAERGHHVEVFFSDRDYKTTGAGTGVANLVLHPLKNFEFAHTPFAPSLFFRLMRIPKGSIMHLHLSQAYYPEMVLLVSKLRGIPYIAHFHLDVGPSGALGNLFLLYKKVMWGPILRNAARVIVFSEKQRDLVIEKYGVHKDKATIIPNGVGDSFFYNRKRDFAARPVRLLYVGRLSVQKRIERLIEAVSLLTIPVHLMIVGDGEDREKMEALAKELKLTNISFEGRKIPEELHSYYEKADLFVIPSDIEGMPLAVLEAMAEGLPVIGSNVTGIQELVKGAGVLVDDPSPETFAAAITSSCEQPGFLATLSAQSTERARQYSWGMLIKKLESVYKEIYP